MKNVLRIIVGLLLFAAAYKLHYKAVAITDEALDAPRTVDNPIAPGMEDQFFGIPPTEAIKKPENQAKLATARRVESLAGIALLASGFLTLLGLAPLVFGILGWLFIPDSMRRSHAPDACDAPDREIADPAVDAAVEAKGDSESDRSLAIPSKEVPDRLWRGRASASASTHGSPSALIESHEQPSGGDPPGPTRERPQ